MSTPAIPAVWPQSLGINADVVDIPTTTPSGQGVPSFSGVFPPLTAVDPAAGGYFIEREWMNALFKILGENVWYQQHGAIYPWSDALDYPVNAHVLGSDGREYRALQQSGPGLTEGAQDPTSAGGAAYWQLFGNDLFLCNRVFKLISATPPAGFVPCTGTLIADAATRYPKAYAYLQTTEGQTLCVDEATWQSMSTAIYYTDAAGNTYGWDGVGGVCKFVIDTNAGTIRVPDLRGLHEEAYGYNSLAVGQVAHDMMRSITGIANLAHGSSSTLTGMANLTTNGSFVARNSTKNSYSLTSNAVAGRQYLDLDTSRQAPAGPRTSPARYGVLPCVYLGS